MESLNPSPAIDSIYDLYTEKIFDDDNSADRGIQFFLDTHDPTDLSSFYRYEWEQTYVQIAPFDSRYTFFPLLPREESLRKCWKTESSNELLVGSSTGSVGNRLSEYPINFVSANSNRLRYRYSLLAKQYAISESAYSYYRKVKEFNETTGSLFDQQQGSIIGNIRSVDRPTEPVLGYFEVAGVSKLRVFFNLSDLDRNLELNSTFLCELLETNADSAVYYRDFEDLLMHDFNIRVDENGFMDTVYLMTSEACGDCTRLGTNKEPSFWID